MGGKWNWFSGIVWILCETSVFEKHVVEDIRTDDIDGDAKNCQKPYVLNTTKGSRKILRPFFQSHMWFWIGRVKNGLYTCSYFFFLKRKNIWYQIYMLYTMHWLTLLDFENRNWNLGNAKLENESIWPNCNLCNFEKTVLKITFPQIELA